MFSKVNVRTLGVIENMSGFVCPDCGHEHDIFGSGGGEKIARELELDVLGRIPLEPGVRAGGDAGVPITSSQYPGGEDSPAAAALREVARTVAGRVSVLAAPRSSGRPSPSSAGRPKVPRSVDPPAGDCPRRAQPENRRHANRGHRRHPCQPARAAGRARRRRAASVPMRFTALATWSDAGRTRTRWSSELRRLDVPTVQGNWDEAVGMDRDRPGPRGRPPRPRRPATRRWRWTADR